MDKKKKILSSARTLFAQNGFQGTSLSQIASDAKTQKQLITHHFGTKDNLWQEVVNKEFVDGVEILRSVKQTAEEKGAEAGIRQFIHDYIHWCSSKQDIHRIMIFDSQANNPRFQWYAKKHFQPHYKIMTALLKTAQTQGVICEGDPGRIYFTFMNMINSLVLGELTFKLYTGRAPNNNDDIENLKRMVYKVLEMKVA